MKRVTGLFLLCLTFTTTAVIAKEAEPHSSTELFFSLWTLILMAVSGFHFLRSTMRR